MGKQMWKRLTAALLLSALLLTACSSQVVQRVDLNSHADDVAVYVKANGLWCVDAGGNPLPILLDTEGKFARPVISTDGRSVAYLKDTSLCIAPLTDDRPVTVKVADNVVSYVWQSADALIYSAQEGGLYRYNVSNAVSTSLCDAERVYDGMVCGAEGNIYTNVSLPAQAETGKPLQPLGIMMYHVDSGQQIMLIEAEKSGEGVYSMGSDPVIAGLPAEGQYLYVWYKPQSGSLSADGVTLRAYDLMKKKLLPAVEGADVFGLTYADSLAFRPRHSESVAIVGGAGRDMNRNKQLQVFDAEANQLQTLTQEDMVVMTPAYARNGKDIYYAASASAESLEEWASLPHGIYKMDAASRQGETVTTGAAGFDFYPQELSDREKLLFIRRNADRVFSLMLTENGRESTIDTGLQFGDSYYGHYDVANVIDLFVRE